MDFILATNNMKKLAEMQRILSPLGINVVTAKMLGIILPEVVEDGDTFEANAKIKAESACKITGLPAIADDSGLCVDYLGGIRVFIRQDLQISKFTATNVSTTKRTPTMRITTISCLKNCRALQKATERHIMYAPYPAYSPTAKKFP